uniref:CCR4-NOT transcription complex subunit 2 n=1 Tax=Eptatretus burgeri TaxID=7764 RepID=A0A8C4NGX8_EPTBU
MLRIKAGNVGRMFSLSKKRFGDEGEGDFEPNLYFNQSSVFHRPDKEMLGSPSPSGQLSQFGASLYGPQTPLSLQLRGMGAAPLARGLNPGHVTPTSAVTPLPLHTATSPSRMAGFGLSRNQSYGLSNVINNTYSSPGGDSVPGLDLSDFPALADRNRRESNGNSAPPPNPMAGRTPYVGMVTKVNTEQPQDFSIHNEDFPALPGAKEGSEENKLSNQSSNTTSNEGPKFPGDKAPVSSNANLQKKGIQILADGRVTNIPAGMVTDQFGMIGLLTFIRAAETEPSLVHLALGSDLTTLGLNLNSPENLYPKFASPWAESPCRPQDIDFHVPSEYLTNIHIRDKLAPIKLPRYGEDLLFYMYYTNGGDMLQLAAAAELYNRDWRYHKEERVWITRAPGMEPQVKTNAYERGTYYYFDCHNWRKVAKEFHLEYDKLEERPYLPNPLNYNPAQQAY